MNPRLRKLVALGLLSLALANPASAQMYDGSAYAFPVADFVGPMLSSSVMSNSSYTSGKSSKRKRTTTRKAPTRTVSSTKTATLAQKQRLVFTPSAAVTRQSNEKIATLLASQGKAKRDYLLGELNKGSLSRAFEQVVAPYNLSSRNVGDVMTAYLLVNWKVVNGVGGALNKNNVEAMRRATNNNLALSPKLRTMSNTQKQLVAENLAGMATLLLIADNESRRKNDTATLRRIQQNVRQTNLKTFGVDLKKVSLTSRGLA